MSRAISPFYQMNKGPSTSNLRAIAQGVKQGHRLFEEAQHHDVLSHDSKGESNMSEGYLSAYDEVKYE
jgi:hypothetical protein